MAVSTAEKQRLEALRKKARTTRLGYSERAELAELEAKAKQPAGPAAKKKQSSTVTTTGSVRMADRRAEEQAAKKALLADRHAAELATSSPPTTSSSATSSPSAPGVSSAPSFSVTPDAEKLARDQFGFMAWALDDPELGPVLRKAAEEGWDTNRLKGAVFGTEWFRVHGTVKVAEGLKRVAESYLIPLGDDALRSWAMKVVTGEVNPEEFRRTMVQKAKGQWGDFGGALDRGFTILDIADDYRQMAAQELEVAPETVDFMDPKWQRLIVRRDPESGRLVNPTLADATAEIRSNDVYGWDRTRKARDAATGLITEFGRMFGRSA